MRFLLPGDVKDRDIGVCFAWPHQADFDRRLEQLAKPQDDPLYERFQSDRPWRPVVQVERVLAHVDALELGRPQVRVNHVNVIMKERQGNQRVRGVARVRGTPAAIT